MQPAKGFDSNIANVVFHVALLHEVLGIVLIDVILFGTTEY